MKVYEKLFKVFKVSVIFVIALLIFPLLCLFVTFLESSPEFEADFLSSY